jgi:biopolymer transport protein ExbB
MLKTLYMIMSGGWPMIPLGLCSFVAVTVIAERLLALRRRRILDPRLVEAVTKFRGEESVRDTALICRNVRGPFARIVEEVLRTRHLEHAQTLEIMHAAGRTQTGRLEYGLTLLEIIAATSPLLGLLGTVLGMVEVFNAITIEGLGDPRVLSGGISQALITTVAGLCVAIPALVFHSLFMRRVEDLGTEMQNLATMLIMKIQAGSGKSGAP